MSGQGRAGAFIKLGQYQRCGPQGFATDGYGAWLHPAPTTRATQPRFATPKALSVAKRSSKAPRFDMMQAPLLTGALDVTSFL